jgi:hypothetical protein
LKAISLLFLLWLLPHLQPSSLFDKGRISPLRPSFTSDWSLLFHEPYCSHNPYKRR